MHGQKRKEKKRKEKKRKEKKKKKSGLCYPSHFANVYVDKSINIFQNMQVLMNCDGGQRPK